MKSEMTKESKNSATRNAPRAVHDMGVKGIHMYIPRYVDGKI